jgi:Protein of unknown function (DUF2905)
VQDLNSLGLVGRFLAIAGGITLLIGIALIFARRIPFLGRLPGDVFVRTDHVSIFFPIVTMIILSVVLTVILNIVVRFFR